MQIEAISFPSSGQKREIQSLIGHCTRADKYSVIGAEEDQVTYELEFDENFRKAGEFNTFLLRLKGKLVAVLNIFAPGSIEGEISAFTLPAHRRSGMFRQLVEAARKELLRRGYSEMLFVVPGDSESGKAAVTHLGGSFAHSEYAMRLDKELYQRQPRDHIVPTGNGQRGQIRIIQAGEKDRQELLRLAGISFGDSAEDGERYLEGTLGVPGRSIHIARLEETLTGMVSMVHGEQKFYIHGLSVFPEFQKRGIGGALLRYKVEEALATDPERPVELEVATENSGALSLYTRSGFRVVTRYDYYRLQIRYRDK